MGNLLISGHSAGFEPPPTLSLIIVTTAVIIRGHPVEEGLKLGLMGSANIGIMPKGAIILKERRFVRLLSTLRLFASLFLDWEILY